MANVVSSLPLPRHGGSVPAADPTQVSVSAASCPCIMQCRGMMTGRARELERERTEAEALQRTAQPAWPLLQLPTPIGPQSVPLLSPAAFFGGSAPSLLVPPPMQVLLAVKHREGLPALLAANKQCATDSLNQKWNFVKQVRSHCSRCFDSGAGRRLLQQSLWLGLDITMWQETATVPMCCACGAARQDSA